MSVVSKSLKSLTLSDDKYLMKQKSVNTIFIRAWQHKRDEMMSVLRVETQRPGMHRVARPVDGVNIRVKVNFDGASHAWENSKYFYGSEQGLIKATGIKPAKDLIRSGKYLDKKPTASGSEWYQIPFNELQLDPKTAIDLRMSFRQALQLSAPIYKVLLGFVSDDKLGKKHSIGLSPISLWHGAFSEHSPSFAAGYEKAFVVRQDDEPVSTIHVYDRFPKDLKNIFTQVGNEVPFIFAVRFTFDGPVANSSGAKQSKTAFCASDNFFGSMTKRRLPRDEH